MCVVYVPLSHTLTPTRQLGPGDSGRTTFAKNLVASCKGDSDIDDRKASKDHLIQNLRQAIQELSEFVLDKTSVADGILQAAAPVPAEGAPEDEKAKAEERIRETRRRMCEGLDEEARGLAEHFAASSEITLTSSEAAQLDRLW